MADQHGNATQIRPGVGAGTRLNGIYEIERLIAVGGMGEVYKGRAIQTGDAVAIKTIRPELAQNEAALGLFRKEAAALHNLYHEAIVRYYVFSVDPDVGAPYLAMEYVDGQPLSEVVKKGALGYEAMRVLQRRLAAGLQAAHELGIVHRDVSPDNVILPAGNVARAKIIDFGIARSTMLGDATIIGHGVAGKFAYMSPEQLGLFGGDVTAKSDIYSLGLVLAEALTGRPLDMGGSQVQVVEKRRKVPDLSGVDARLRPLLEKMLQPKPADRIASMAEVASWQPAASAPAGTRRTPLLIGGIAALAVLGGVAVLVVPGRFGTGPVEEPSPGASNPPVLTPDAPDPTTRPQPSPSPPVPGDVRPGPAPSPSPATDDRAPAAPAPVPTAPTQPVAPAPSEPQPAPQPTSTEAIARYIRDYEGGECFFLNPLSLGPKAATIEGFGTSGTPFKAFDEAFKRRHGFEAQINVRLVSEAQCPAIAFLKEVGIDPERSPKLQIEAFVLRESQPLNGTVERPQGRHVEVLLVSDDGYARSLAEFLKPNGDGSKFSLRLKRPSSQGAKPQLVIAIASPQPLALLGAGTPIAAETLFPLLLDEARRQGTPLDLAVKYFRLEG